jgi:hypothetical protein
LLEKNEQARDGYREQSDPDEVQAAPWLVMMSSTIRRQPRQCSSYRRSCQWHVRKEGCPPTGESNQEPAYRQPDRSGALTRNRKDCHLHSRYIRIRAGRPVPDQGDGSGICRGRSGAYEGARD